MRTAIVVVAVVAVIVVVIIVNAPPPDGESAADRRMIPIATVFAILEAENDSVRRLWASRVVGDGREQGLNFNEDWRRPEVEAGPLPALFLRETGERIRRNPAPLYLFLGSDFPINDANKFTGLQTERFNMIKKTGEPQFFFDEDVEMNTGMFSDIAVSEACVVCHNNDPESPKTDWKVGDIMGATTWSYPKDEVTVEEALEIVRALRKGLHETYDQYLTKVATFENPPAVGDKWPSDGYFLPSSSVFMEEAELRVSADTLRTLLDLQYIHE